jgi:hypothetical protein
MSECDEQKLRAKAQKIVRSAIRKGTLTRQPCSVCGTTENVDGHHEDYDRPLDVTWLCRKHHRLRHTRLGLRKWLEEQLKERV